MIKAQTSNATLASTSTTSAICLQSFYANSDSYKSERTQVIFYNASAAAVITLIKSDATATAGTGIVLKPGGTYFEATDGGYKCYQGAFTAVSDVAGSLSIVETWIDV